MIARRADVQDMTDRVAAASRRGRGTQGFSLVEVVIAITLAAVLLTGGARALGSSLKAAVFARSNSQAAELLSERIEDLRSADYAAIAMTAADAASDPAVSGTAPALSFDPDGSGPLTAEPLVLASTGLVSPHVTTADRNTQKYSLHTYVTAPADAEVAGAGYKRVTVRATWKAGASSHERSASTIVTRTRRGLPLPNFQITATDGQPGSPITVNAGAELVLPFDVVNRGARDAFNLTVASTPSMAAAFTLLVDSGTSTGTHDADDTDAPDSDGNGVRDTGLMAVDASQSMLAVATVPSSTVGSSYTFTVTATSSGQPTAVGATRSATFAVKVVNDLSCSGCTYLPAFLRNVWPPCASEPCNSTAQATMPLRTEAPTATSLGNFDTDVDTAPGRMVKRAASTPAWSATDPSTVATWRYVAGRNVQLNGTMLVDLNVSRNASLSATAVRVYVNRSTNGSGATEAVTTATVDATGGTAFQTLRVSIPVSTTIAKNRFLEIKVVVDSTLTTLLSGDVVLGYDAVTYGSNTNPAAVYLPVA